MRSFSPTRLRSRFAALYPLPAALVLLPAQAHAALLLAPDCSASGNSLDCRLSGVLSFLTIAAVLLAMVLLLVIVLAVRSYRRKDDESKGNR